MLSDVLQRLKCSVRPADGWKPATASYSLAENKDGINKDDRPEKEGTEMKLFLHDKQVPMIDI